LYDRPMVHSIPKDQPCPHCGRWHTRATTLDAVIVHNGRVLLVQRKEDPFKGYWALPGGYLDDNERLAEAAVREALEETGIRCRNPQLIGVFDDPKRHPQQALAMAFSMEAINPNDARVGDAKEIGGVMWAPLSDLPRLAFDHRDILMTYKRKFG